MTELAIYMSVLALFLVLGAAVRVYRHVPTRLCPLCEARVELGRTHCQSCGYRFTAARY